MNPRNGLMFEGGIDSRVNLEINTPDNGEKEDWVLILENDKDSIMRNCVLDDLKVKHEALLTRKNIQMETTNGIYCRYKYPVLTADHAPLIWRYDFNPVTNRFMEERIGVNAVMNSGAIKLDGKYYLMVRVEGMDRKSFLL